MKLLAALISLSLTVGAISASVDDIGDSTAAAIKNGLMNVHRDLGISDDFRRDLGISAECEANSETLYNSASLLNGYSQLGSELGNLSPDCNQSTLTCLIDASEAPSHGSLEGICLGEGGSHGVFTTTAKCAVRDGTTSATLTIKLVDIPLCIASGCDETAGEAFAEIFSTSFAQVMEVGLGTQYDSVSCTAGTPTIEHGGTGGGTTTTNGGNSGANGLNPKVLYGTAASFLVAFIF